MFNPNANLRSLLDDPKLAEKVASARQLVGEIVPAAPRTETQLQNELADTAKSAAQVNAEIEGHVQRVRAERDVKVACVVHIATVCERLLA